MSDLLQQAFQHYRPRKILLRNFFKRSAVAIILRKTPLKKTSEATGQNATGLEFLMIKRAGRNGDPWSGHMAFPGGRVDPGDSGSYAAAVRETKEEVDLDITTTGDYIGRLSDIYARPHKGLRPMTVTPHVFLLSTENQDPILTPNYEVADTFWIPLNFILNPGNRDKMDFKVGAVSIQLPCYYYQSERIWGLSLMMLDNLAAVLTKDQP